MESTTPYYVYRSILSDLFMILEEAKVEKDSKYVIPTENRVSKIIRRSSSTIKAKKNNINNSYINGEGELYVKESSDFDIYDINGNKGKSVDSIGKSTIASKENSFIKDKAQFKKPINLRTSEDLKPHSDSFTSNGPEKSNSYLSEADQYDIEFKINRVTELENRLKTSLEKFGENALMYPVFNVVYPHNFMDNDLTVHIRGQNRHKEFFEILKRIITNVSSKYPLIFLIQEAQFTDYSSWQLTNKVMFIIR